MTVELLRRLETALAVGEPLAPGDAEAIAEALHAWRTGRAATLDAAFGVQTGPGRRRQATRAALAGRDALLRVVRHRHYSDLPLSEAARQIAAGLARYRSTAWRREHHLDAAPPERAGTPAGIFWRILRAHDADLSARRVRAVLATKPPVFVASESGDSLGVSGASPQAPPAVSV
ncbi:hypothetical protein [Alsobacter sp. R-9]